MKKSKFTEQQVAFALQQTEGGTNIGEVCRRFRDAHLARRWHQTCSGTRKVVADPCRSARRVERFLACRATYHYRSRRPEQAPVRKRIREIAETHVFYGYRRIAGLLRREGWHVNVKRVHRLYCLEGLQMRLKQPRRRVVAKLRDDRSDATGPKQVWAMDWMRDALSGRRLWVLTVVDT